MGFLFSVVRDRAVYVKTFGVLPAYQRQGVGRLLYEAICRRAMEDGCEAMYGLMIRNDKPINQLLPPESTKVAEYVLFKEEVR